MKAVEQEKMPAQCLRVLVVDDEQDVAELMGNVLHDLDCHVTRAANLADARNLIKRQGFDLLVTDIMLPDGSGLGLLSDLHRCQPAAGALVVTGVPTVDLAVTAIRGGALDLLPKPFTIDQLTDSFRRALVLQRHIRRRESRVERLREAFKRLNASRRQVSKKVDLLCNDLITAYGDLSRQFDSVRVLSGYRQAIADTDGLEQLLCHTMDWLMRQLGYANIGIWLAASDDSLQLGAYMRYTIAADAATFEAMQRNLLRIAIRRGLVHIGWPESQSHLSPPELKQLAQQDILAVNCTYLGDTLAVFALFRDHKTPFTDDDVATLKAIAPLFATALSQQAHRADEDQGAVADDDGDQPKKRRRKDPADWWKTGEDPPF